MLNEMIALLSPYCKKGDKMGTHANSIKKRKKVASKKKEDALTTQESSRSQQRNEVDPPATNTPPVFGPPPHAIEASGTLYGEADDGTIFENKTGTPK